MRDKDKIRQDQKRLEKKRDDKTRQDKIRQDKTRDRQRQRQTTLSVSMAFILSSSETCGTCLQEKQGKDEQAFLRTKERRTGVSEN